MAAARELIDARAGGGRMTHAQVIVARGDGGATAHACAAEGEVVAVWNLVCVYYACADYGCVYYACADYCCAYYACADYGCACK